MQLHMPGGKADMLHAHQQRAENGITQNQCKRDQSRGNEEQSDPSASLLEGASRSCSFHPCSDRAVLPYGWQI
jgi:hypothetical protein